MPIKRFYIQQLNFDGVKYQKGNVVDLLSAFNIGIQSISYKMLPEIKDLPTRNWLDEDGEDVYVPSIVHIKSYDLEVTFVYKGNEQSIYQDVPGFIKFLYGHNESAVGARLAIYDEFTRTGRKDVFVKSVSDDVFYYEEFDSDSIGAFKVKFCVCDPSTDVVPQYGGNNVVTDLRF